MKKVKSSLKAMILLSILAIGCRKTVIKEVEVPGPPIEIGFFKDDNYQDQVVTPGNGTTLGVFTIFNNQPSRIARIIGGEVEIRSAAGNVFRNLSIYTDSSNVYIAHPRDVTPFSLNAALPAGSSTRLHFSINTDVADTGIVQAFVKLTIAWGENEETVFGPVAGQIMNMQLPQLDTVYLTSWGTTAPQFVATKNSAVDATELSYQMETSTGGGLRIVELKFGVVGTQTASAIRVGGESAPFVNGVAHLTNLNVWTWGSMQAYVSYPSVGTNGLPSGTNSQVVLTHVTYTDGVRMTTVQPNIAGNTMKLVGSKPRVEVFQSNATLTNGLVRAIDVTVAADDQGEIMFHKLPIQVQSNFFNPIMLGSGTAIVVRDDNNQTISTQSTAFSNSIATITFNNGYRIPAGTTAKFRIFVPVTYAGPNAFMRTSIVASDDFVWRDIAGNATLPYTGTTHITNYPDYFTSIVRN